MTGIQMAMMATGSEPTVYLENLAPSDYQFSPSSANASYSVNNNRTTTYTGGSTPNWLSLDGNVADYEIRVDLTSGTFSSGSGIGVWLSLGVSRSWGLFQSSTGYSEAIFNVQIRRVSSGVVKATATITMSAQVDN
jgi:hypothetical protein